MNNDAPETLAAARSRAADLEQQLKLSDEGVSRLAQRCLELEQQVLNYQAALARHGSDNEPAALTLPQLFYDSGSGYSPRECLTVAEDAYDELTHEVSAVFTLPTDARALRLDPGELACCVTDLSISDEQMCIRDRACTDRIRRKKSTLSCPERVLFMFCTYVSRSTASSTVMSSFSKAVRYLNLYDVRGRLLDYIFYSMSQKDQEIIMNFINNLKEFV